MADSDNIRDAAAAASAALRDFAAHARDGVDGPDTRKLISELLDQLTSTRQIISRISSAQLTQRAAAHGNAGQLALGVQAATASSHELRRATFLLEQVEFRLDAAAQETQKITWVRDGAAGWVLVLTVRGDGADAVDDAIDSGSVESAVSRLALFDRGEETTLKALRAGECWEHLPGGPIDRVATSGEYALVSRPLTGDVLFLRALTEPDPHPKAGTVTPLPPRLARPPSQAHAASRPTRRRQRPPTRLSM